MPARHICPSMGALRRPISHNPAALSNCCSRGFHASARRLEGLEGDASKKAPFAQRGPRRIRVAQAASQIASLGRRPPLQRKEPTGGDNSGSLGPKVIQPRKPLVLRGTASPPGTMIRAPSTLRISRTSAGPRPRGPNLGARKTANSGGTENTPRRRERKPKGQSAESSRMDEEVKLEDTLSDGMVQQLLRLQRKEWDRVPYVPKYAPDSFEANELIHTGRELFRGDSPPVKMWGDMERALGVVGMYGAEAHLQVRRVPDGDAAPFGSEEAELEQDSGNGSTPKVAGA